LDAIFSQAEDLCDKIGEYVGAKVPVWFEPDITYIDDDLPVGGETFIGRCGAGKPGGWANLVDPLLEQFFLPPLIEIRDLN